MAEIGGSSVICVANLLLGRLFEFLKGDKIEPIDIINRNLFHLFVVLPM